MPTSLRRWNGYDHVKSTNVRALRLASECYAGAALARLRDLADSVNPTPPTGDGDHGARLMEAFSFHRRNEWATLVHSPSRPQEGRTRRQEVDADVAQVERDARLIEGELRQRIVLGHSRQALVRRYAARCEGFDGERLRGLCEGDTRQAERHLTRDFARYLFDQGLTPLIEPTAGGLRPDLLDLRIPPGVSNMATVTKPVPRSRGIPTRLQARRCWPDSPLGNTRRRLASLLPLGGHRARLRVGEPRASCACPANRSRPSACSGLLIGSDESAPVCRVARLHRYDVLVAHRRDGGATLRPRRSPFP